MPPAKSPVERMVAPVLLTPEARDVHSYARPAEARVTNVALDLDVDFAAKIVRGTATLDLQVASGATQLVLDTNGLKIDRITNGSGRLLLWNMGRADAIHGAPLTVTLDGARQVTIRYATAPDARALQWMAPEQTAGKQHPFLFSQGEAILNRSWIPTQDSPGIRQTWQARITVPADLTAVMSAEGNVTGGSIARGEPAADGRHVFTFHMDRPVAPYLIALAVGDIGFKSTGPRTGIFAERPVLDGAATEFSDLEKFVDAAEGLYGPYRWGRYDVLVLPPSFPFGGMENPNMTFATPTILAGDKSLVSVIAHELAHSWSGNLVTNATWNDFWLNEGFTSYFENRIMEKIYGERRAAMEADLGWSELQAAIAENGGPKGADTQLHLNFAADRDPDDATTDIAYQKGATFLRTIEAAVGRDKFDAYLTAYFDRHAFQPQTSAGFVRDLREHLIMGDKALEQKLQIDRWVFEPGLPENAVHVVSEALTAVDKEATAFVATGTIPKNADDWQYPERVRFLNDLPRTLPVERLKALDDRFALSTNGNSEVRFAWLALAIGNRYPPAAASSEQFLVGQGRRKFVVPLFKALMKQGDWGRPLARTIYSKARPGYHPLTVGSVDPVVGAP